MHILGCLVLPESTCPQCVHVQCPHLPKYFPQIDRWQLAWSGQSAVSSQYDRPALPLPLAPPLLTDNWTFFWEYWRGWAWPHVVWRDWYSGTVP